MRPFISLVCSVLLFRDTGMAQETGIHPHGPLDRYVKLRVAHAPGMPGTFSPPPRVSNPEMHHGTCVANVPCCMPGSLTSGIPWSRWLGKRSRHSPRLRNPYFFVADKKPMGDKYPLILNNQYYDCLSPGSLHRQAISSHEMNRILQWYYGLIIIMATKRCVSDIMLHHHFWL